MTIPVALRGDFKASQLRGLARKTKDGPQARRLLTLAAIYDGATRTEAAKIGGVTLQIIRDWVMRFNARGAAGLLDGKSPGQPSRLNDVQRQAIVRMVESGPIPAIHGVVRWRLIYRRYLELSGVNALVRDLREKDIRTKMRLRATGATHGGIGRISFPRSRNRHRRHHCQIAE